jgi:hypothetical protein
MQDFILNFTPTGMVPTRALTPHVPLTPEEIVEEVVHCADLGAAQLPAMAIALAVGGGVRVGLEDNLWFDGDRTELATNAALVERVVALGRLLGRARRGAPAGRLAVGRTARMTSPIRKIRDVVRHGLLLQTLLDLLRRIGLEITPYYVVEESLDWLPEELPPTQVPDLTMRCLEPADAALAAMPDGAITEVEARERLESGVWGLGAWSGSELIAFVWADLTELDFDPCRRPLAADEAYLFGARTSRRCRGMNLNPALRREMYAQLAGRGRTRLVSISYALNRPAIRFKQELGARFTHLYLFISRGGRWRCNWRRR